MNNVDVAVWLGIKGGKEGEREFQSFGRAGKASLNEIREAARTLPPHLVAVSRGVAGVREGVDDLVARSGSMGRVASSFGAAGVAGAAAGVAIGLAAKATFDMARGAMIMGDAIGDAAEQAQVGTDTLQELQYAALKSGIGVEKAGSAIIAFRTQIGLAEAGTKRALQWFEKLGFTQEQLRNMGSFDEKLEAVTRRIADLGDDQAFAAAAKVGLGDLLPLLRKGGDEMARLRKEAHDLGFVMDEEMVRSLGEANDKFEASAHIIQVQLRSAFAGLAGDIAEGSAALAGFIGKLDALAKKAGAKGGLGEFLADAAIATLPGGAAINMVRQRKTDWSKFVSPERGFRSDGGGADGSLLDTASGGGGGGASAARRAAQQLDRFAGARSQAETALAGEYAKGANLEIGERYQLEHDIILLERKHREAELRRMVKDGDLTAAQAEQLKLAEERVRQGKLANSAEAERREVEDHRLAAEKALADLNDELLTLALDGARTQAERRRLELKALEARRAQERHALEVGLGRDPNLSEGDRARRLAGFDAATAGQRAGINRATMGPLDQFRDGFLRSADEIEEALQRVAVDAVGTLSDGLVDAIMNARSLGEVFTNVSGQIVAGLARIAIQTAIIQPLADALFGGGGGGGGFWGTITSALGSALGGAMGGGGGGNWSAFTDADLANAGLTRPGRASGGPVYRGDVRPWRELGMERLAATSDGYVFDHMATARAADRGAAMSPGASSPIAVNLTNRSGMPLQAKATERQSEGGGRTLDIELIDLMDSRAEAQVRELTSGRKYDGPMGQNLGIRRRLSGA